MNLYISSVGMTNPLGIGALPSAAAVRAGINRYENSEAEGVSGEPIKVAQVPDDCLPELDVLDCSQQGALYQRLLQLALQGLNEAVSQTDLQGAVPLMLALPEQRCGQPFPAMESILKDLNQLSEAHIDMLTSRIFTQGRAAGMQALEEAAKILTTTAAPAVIVGGVDSYLDTELLQQLDQQKRMMGDNSFDGFVPGEGAAFIVLQNAVTQKNSGAGAPSDALSIRAVATTSEAGHYYSDEHCLGEGLTSAFAQVLESPEFRSQGKAIETILCSMNGESQQVKEWGFALTRNSGAFSPAATLEHPAEYFGDLGAATVPTLLGLAHIGLSKQYLSAPILLWGASDDALRGACVIA